MQPITIQDFRHKTRHIWIRDPHKLLAEVVRALVIVLPCYGALEIVGVIIIIIIIPR